MITIETVEETGSTNADLLARLDAGEKHPEGYWLRAKRQSGGRGRLGRKWQSPAGNLFCSTTVNLRSEDTQPHTLSFVTALSVHDALSAHLTNNAGLVLKWPNDALISGAKIAGILLERAGNCVVVGIGINVDHAPKLADRKTTSLLDENAGQSIGADAVLESLSHAFDNRLSRWRTGGVAATLDDWMERGHAIGTRLSLSPSDDETLAGYFAGLDASGALLLRLANGAMRTIHAGDVSMMTEG